MYDRTEEEQAEYETWCREYADWYYNNLMEEERENGTTLRRSGVCITALAVCTAIKISV